MIDQLPLLSWGWGKTEMEMREGEGRGTLYSLELFYDGVKYCKMGEHKNDKRKLVFLILWFGTTIKNEGKGEDCRHSYLHR
jgi:hypothetical protein